MTHVRKQLRDAVVAELTGLTTTGSRVFTARVYPLQDAELPCLLINTVSETAEALELSHPGIVGRAIRVEVEGLVRGVSGLADTLDTIAEEVETALGSPVTVSGKSVILDYAGAEIQFSGETDKPGGSVILRFDTTLYTQSSAPGTLVSA